MGSSSSSSSVLRAKMLALCNANEAAKENADNYDQEIARSDLWATLRLAKGKVYLNSRAL